jgi:hypothetical protein
MPVLSPDGTRVAAVFDDDIQHYALHILSAETGEILRSIPNPENHFYTHPQWSEDARFLITAPRLPDGRMTLLSYDLAEDGIRELIPPTYAPIGRPHLAGEWVYFTMTQGETDQVFRVHRSTRYLEQVTTDPVSKYQPIIDPVSGQLIYTRYSLKGKKLFRSDVNGLPFQLVKKEGVRLREIETESNENDLLLSTQNIPFTVTRYPLLSRPIRLHSWSLYSDDPVYGIELLSENTLNTIQWRSGWEYNRNSGYHGPFTDLTIGLWYPQIVAGY